MQTPSLTTSGAPCDEVKGPAVTVAVHVGRYAQARVAARGPEGAGDPLLDGRRIGASWRCPPAQLPTGVVGAGLRCRGDERNEAEEARNRHCGQGTGKVAGEKAAKSSGQKLALLRQRRGRTSQHDRRVPPGQLPRRPSLERLAAATPLGREEASRGDDHQGSEVESGCQDTTAPVKTTISFPEGFAAYSSAQHCFFHFGQRVQWSCSSGLRRRARR